MAVVEDKDDVHVRRFQCLSELDDTCVRLGEELGSSGVLEHCLIARHETREVVERVTDKKHRAVDRATVGSLVGFEGEVTERMSPTEKNIRLRKLNPRILHTVNILSINVTATPPPPSTVSLGSAHIPRKLSMSS